MRLQLYNNKGYAHINFSNQSTPGNLLMNWEAAGGTKVGRTKDPLYKDVLLPHLASSHPGKPIDKADTYVSIYEISTP